MKRSSNLKTIYKVIVVLGLLATPSLVWAEIYKWVDDKGTVNFTQDPETIPQKYRDKTENRTTEEDLMTTEEKIRAKKKYGDEVRERQKRERKEYDLKEFEKQVKKMEDQAKKKREEGRCEIISYSQYDVVTNVSGGGGQVIPGSGGIVSGGTVSAWKSTCVELVIKNNAPEAKTITAQNLVATSSKSGDKINPKAVLIQIGPGETYRGSICFKKLFPIAKLELQGL